MKRCALVLSLLSLLQTGVLAQPADWGIVQQILGRKGMVAGDILKEPYPRTDLHVKIEDTPVEAGLALTSWIAFRPMSGQTMAMGDLVLLESEVNPVMKTLVAHGWEITALHNHILNETPTVMYMHVSARGDAAKLAEALKDVLSRTATPTGPPPLRPEPAIMPEWPGIDSIMGYKGQHNGNLLQFSIPRADTIREEGMTIPPVMGMAISINLQRVGAKAATTGDFVLTSAEVNPVLEALTDHGIAVTALHSHMLNEMPRLFFMHFWGVDDPQDLAKGLRAALDRTNALTGK
jgi:hypothetical protein